MTLLHHILAEGAAAGPSLFSSLMPMIAIMGIFYFLLIRPQQQMKKKQELMRNSLSKNDKVITESGIHGIITGLTDKTVTLKVAEGVSMKFERFAVAQVVSESKSSEDGE
ncbi:MAG: preprotein translocase subunit YajC [Verrucomicrobiales bacterium]|nr:preprotein translocase subunit YajC [Verrucomicrobiales bacterium]